MFNIVPLDLLYNDFLLDLQKCEKYTWRQTLHVSAMSAVANNIVQKNSYYYKLELFMTTFWSQLDNSRPIFHYQNSDNAGCSFPGFQD